MLSGVGASNLMPADEPLVTCGAKTRSWHLCPLRPTPIGRCRMDGATTRRGMATSQCKHGRSAKVLPLRRAAYEQARTNDVLLALRGEAALLQTWIDEMLTRLDMGDPAAGDEVVWTEVRATIGALRRVSEAERQRLVAMPAMVTADEGMALSAAVTAVVRECIITRRRWRDSRPACSASSRSARVASANTGGSQLLSALRRRSRPRSGLSADRCMAIPHAQANLNGFLRCRALEST
jgi:hypothetical protein